MKRWQREYDPTNGPKYYKHCVSDSNGRALGWVSNKQDANLMVAAPELLQALKALTMRTDAEEEIEAVCERAKKIIKKIK